MEISEWLDNQAQMSDVYVRQYSERCIQVMSYEPQDPMDEENDKVACVFGCPRCGERRFAYLEWTYEGMEEVECQTCGKVYSPLDA
jgi:hypothetical protein